MSEPPSSISRTRRRLAIALLAVVVLVAALGAWRWRSDRAYVGTERALTLSWSCLNYIVWNDPDRDDRWVASGVPVADDPGAADGSASPGSPPTRTATGTLHFDDPDRATFRGRAGDSITMTRESKQTFHTLECAIN